VYLAKQPCQAPQLLAVVQGGAVPHRSGQELIEEYSGFRIGISYLGCERCFRGIFENPEFGAAVEPERGCVLRIQTKDELCAA
jgi:hypothetical protein